MSTDQLLAYLTSLEQIARQSPEDGSVPFVIGKRQCGFVSPRAATVLKGQCLALNQDGRIVLSQEDALDEQLARIAQTLLEGGCISKWRGELLDVWCDNNVVGAIERGAVRSLGLLTRAVHLNAWSTNGELWVARRALDKPTDPGMWDTLVGGLVGYGESDELALERESAEEAGLSPLQIVQREPIQSIYQMKRRVPEGFQCEEVLTSDCVLADDVDPQNQDGEVMEIACLPIPEIESMLFSGQFTLEASIVIVQSLLARQAL